MSSISTESAEPVKGESFFSKLTAAVQTHDSLLCVGLDPTPAHVPAAYRDQASSIHDSLLRWNLAVIEATAPYVCAYKPNIAFYEALGIEGYHLLTQTIAAIPSHIPVLLDAKRGDIGHTATAYATACFDRLQVDAVTLNPYLGKDSIEPFLAYPDKGLFILCHTSNPGAADFQHLEINDWRTLDREANAPLYIHVAKTAVGWGENVGLVVGATYPQAMEAVRGAAPEAWLLVPGIGAQGGALEETVAAGLRRDGLGMLINASRGVSQADDPGIAAQEFREAINLARTTRLHAGLDVPRQPIAEAQTEEAEPGDKEFLARLSTRLVELGAIQFGTFKLASGIESPIYIDLRLLVSDPSLLALVAEAYAQKAQSIAHDRLAGVPYAALPIGTAVALASGKPLIYPRKEAKAYGLGKDIEGNWQPGERILVIEDLITSGGSIIQSAERMRALGLIVEDCVVLIDREQGGTENLAAAGIRAHSVFQIHDLLQILFEAGHIDAETQSTVTRFLEGSRATAAQKPAA